MMLVFLPLVDLATTTCHVVKVSVLKSFVTLRREHGSFRAFILLVLFSDARQVMDRIERHLLRSEPNNTMIMKKALADDCTMLAVAVSISPPCRVWKATY